MARRNNSSESVKAEKKFHTATELMRYRDQLDPRKYTDSQLEAMLNLASAQKANGVASNLRIALNSRRVLRNDYLKGADKAIVADDRSVDGKGNIVFDGPLGKLPLRDKTGVPVTGDLLVRYGKAIVSFGLTWDRPELPEELEFTQDATGAIIATAAGAESSGDAAATASAAAASEAVIIPGVANTELVSNLNGG
jgi:hypothetical protein